VWVNVENIYLSILLLILYLSPWCMEKPDRWMLASAVLFLNGGGLTRIQHQPIIDINDVDINDVAFF
jgi:hypothetical protein